MAMSGRWKGAVLVLAALGAGADGGSTAGYASTLTRTTLEGFIKEKLSQNRPCLLMFHVDWCKVCQRTFPKFVAAASAVRDRALTMDFAHVDCTNDKSLCQPYDVKGYPTIKLFTPEGGPKEGMNYRGQRTEEAFLSYAERMTRPPVLSFKDWAAFAKTADNETLAAFVAVGSGGEPPAGLLEAARRWRDLHVFAAAPRLADLLPESAAPPAGASLAVLSSGRQQWPGADNTTAAQPVAAYFSGPLDDVEAVSKWIERNRFPGVWSLDASNFYFFTHSSRRTAMVAFDPANVSGAHERGLRDAAGRLSDDFTFGVIDGVAWADELSDFNIASHSLPRVLVTEDDFNSWVEDVEALRIESLESDLRNLAQGAPLLRQDRGTLSKLLFYQREALRYAVKVRAYAARGPGQAAAVFAAGLVVLGLLWFVGWVVMSCCQILFADDDEFHQQAAQAVQANRMKKD